MVKKFRARILCQANVIVIKNFAMCAHTAAIATSSKMNYYNAASGEALYPFLFYSSGPSYLKCTDLKLHCLPSLFYFENWEPLYALVLSVNRRRMLQYDFFFKMRNFPPFETKLLFGKAIAVLLVSTISFLSDRFCSMPRH